MNINKQFELQQQEIAALKAQVSALRDALEAGFKSGDDHDLEVWETSTKELLLSTPEQCLNSVKALAYEEGFRYSCAVYNGGSSEQVIEVAVDSYKGFIDEKAKKLHT